MLIKARRQHNHTISITQQTQLPDFTGAERHKRACIARYHRRALPSTSHEEYAILDRDARKRVSALAALLRIADALDYSHDGRVMHLAAQPELCNDSIWTIGLDIRPLSDLDVAIEKSY